MSNTPKPTAQIGEVDTTSKKSTTPLQNLLENTDVLLMLYPKDENGHFSDSISEKDEITIYKGACPDKIKKLNTLGLIS